MARGARRLWPLQTTHGSNQLTPTGVEVVASTPEAFTAWIRTDIERAAKLVKSMGLREEKE